MVKMEGRPLSEYIRGTWESGDLSDVTFIVGEEEVKVKAHKLVLMCKSPVFRRQFESENRWKEGDVTVTDIDVHTFLRLMRYLYTEQVELKLENVETLLYAAEKYMISPLKRMCNAFMNRNVDTSTAVRYLDLSYKFNLSRLTDICRYILCVDGKEVLMSKDCLSLPRSDLLDVLNSNGLKCPESVIFEAVVRWGRAECRKKMLCESDDTVRNELGDLFQAVRFPIMDKAYFADHVSQSKLLSADEKIEIFQLHNASSSKVSTQFSSKPRNQTLYKPHHALFPYERTVPEYKSYGSSIEECMLHVFENKLHCDFTISSDSFYMTAHRYILSLKCPQIIGETNNPFDRQTMEFILRYLYSGKTPLTPANVCDVLDAAYAYRLDLLFNTCRGYIKQSVSDRMVFQYYSAALRHGLETERKLCFERVMSNPRNLLSCTEFLNAHVDVVIEILQSDDLHVPEEDIYQFALRWSSLGQLGKEHEVLSDDVLTKFQLIQRYIRFPIIKFDFLLETVLLHKVFPQDFVIKIAQERASGKQTSYQEFSRKHRSPSWYYNNFSEATTKEDGSDAAADEDVLDGLKPACKHESLERQENQFPSVIKCRLLGHSYNCQLSICAPGYEGKPLKNVDTLLEFCMRDQGYYRCNQHVLIQCNVDQLSDSPREIRMNSIDLKKISACNATVIMQKDKIGPQKAICCRVVIITGKGYNTEATMLPSLQKCIIRKAFEQRILGQDEIKRPLDTLDSIHANLQKSTHYKPILFCGQCFGFCLRLSSSRPVDNADVVLAIIHTGESTPKNVSNVKLVNLMREHEMEVKTENVEFLSGEGRLYLKSPIPGNFVFSLELTYKDLGKLSYVMSVVDSCNFVI